MKISVKKCNYVDKEHPNFTYTGTVVRDLTESNNEYKTINIRIKQIVRAWASELLK